MIGFGRTLVSITKEACCTVRYTIVSCVYNVASVLSFVLPYVMYVLGQYMALDRGYIGFGGELFIPIIVGVLVYYMKGIGNRANKGKRMPVPSKRFTKADGDGEVSIEHARLEEMILFMADLEDWQEKMGML